MVLTKNGIQESFPSEAGGRRTDECRPQSGVGGLSFLQCFDTVSWVTGMAPGL